MLLHLQQGTVSNLRCFDLPINWDDSCLTFDRLGSKKVVYSSLNPRT